MQEHIPEKLYHNHCPIELDKAGFYFTRHMMSMTREGLDSKADIAIQLAYRDMMIQKLKKQNDDMAADIFNLKNVLSAAKLTIRENIELADGDCCTLYDLKTAVLSYDPSWDMFSDDYSNKT